MEPEHRILFFGDMHGTFDHVLPVVQRYRPQAIILLGDIQAEQPINALIQEIMQLTQVWWIPGNHDTDSEAIYDNVYGSLLADYNLNGRVVDIAGLRVAGLGGVFRGKIWHPHDMGWQFFSRQEFYESLSHRARWRDGISLRHRSSIFPEDYMNLRQQQADILVTHEAPSSNLYGFAALDRLAQQMAVKKLFHGHHHDYYDYSGHFMSLGFEIYSVGLRGVSDLNGQAVLRGVHDGQLGNRVANPHNPK
ncbi:metallophosphoesterase family protein [Brackiella oedipodis]|uniref:metallophosphoesterase family protein n=1 Tax=Brackiella oedipodis TaxID=124225 RepID=UPI0005706EFA|nr:metallophosphoesterase [Brackiella oedipodis]